MVDQDTSGSSGHALDDRRRQGAISVGPMEGGWRLEAAIFGQALMFLSGPSAERQARDLARRLSGLGYDMRVEVRDQRNAVSGTFRYRVAAPPPEDADAVFRTQPWPPL